MGKIITKTIVGTESDFQTKVSNYAEFDLIEGAKVYWEDNTGTLAIITNQDRVDYFLGKTEER